MTHLPSIRLQMCSGPAGLSTWKSRSGRWVIEAIRPDPVLQRAYFGAEPLGFPIGAFCEISKTPFNCFW
jgi:hypothetical protein